jgi:hypothetical protein
VNIYWTFNCRFEAGLDTGHDYAPLYIPIRHARAHQL